MFFGFGINGKTDHSMSKKADLLVISWSNEIWLPKSCEPTEFIYETSGKLFAVDERQNKEFAGRFKLS